MALTTAIRLETWKLRLSGANAIYEQGHTKNTRQWRMPSYEVVEVNAITSA